MSVIQAHAPVVPSARPRLRVMSPVGVPDIDAGDRHVGEFWRRLDSWPYLRTERRTQRVILRVRDLVIGTLNLETHSLSVNVPPDSVALLLESRPQLRRTEDGLSVHVTDPHSRASAEALLRWRIELERFAGQLGAASP
jgi:hypothetical protein